MTKKQKNKKNSIVLRASSKSTKSNACVHPAISPILEKLKQNTPWPGQTGVIVTKILPDYVIEHRETRDQHDYPQLCAKCGVYARCDFFYLSEMWPQS